MMFGKKSDITYTFQTASSDRLRDCMEYACRNGYTFNYEHKYAAGVHFYEITIGLSSYQAELMATMALADEALKFHEQRNKERKAEYEDARRDGYAKAVEDMTHDRKD